MPTVASVLSRFRIAAGLIPQTPGPSPGVTIHFNASTTPPSQFGIFAVVGSINANQAFSFFSISPVMELPKDLEISEGVTMKMVVTFVLDYAGASYTYTDTAGNPHPGTFPSDNAAVSY